MKESVIPIAIKALEAIPKGLLTWLEDVEIRERAEAIVKVSRNIEKNPGDLRKFVFAQTPVKDPLLGVIL